MSLFSLLRTKPPFPHYCLPHQLLHVSSLSSLAIQWNLLNQFQWFDTKQNLSKYLTKDVIFFFHMGMLCIWSKMITHTTKPFSRFKKKRIKNLELCS